MIPEICEVEEMGRIDAERYRGEAEVFNTKFLLRIKNCRLKIIDIVNDNPSANDLVNPSQREQRIIQEKLEALSRELEFVTPVVRCHCDVRLKNANKELRHKIELPLIRSAVEELLKREKARCQSIKVRWTNLGKPIVEGQDLKDIAVSVSHDGTFLLVVAGYGKQGCDIEAIQERSRNDWFGILGKDKNSLLEQMIARGNDLNKSGTSIWCAVETFRKNDKLGDRIEIINGNGSYFIFKSPELDEKIQVVSFLIRGEKIILCFELQVIGQVSSCLAHHPYRWTLHLFFS